MSMTANQSLLCRLIFALIGFVFFGLVAVHPALAGGFLMPGDRLHYGESVITFVSPTHQEHSRGYVVVRDATTLGRIQNGGYTYEPHDGEFSGSLLVGSSWATTMRHKRKNKTWTSWYTRICNAAKQENRTVQAGTFPEAILVTCEFKDGKSPAAANEAWQVTANWYWLDDNGFPLLIEGRFTRVEGNRDVVYELRRIDAEKIQ